MSLPRVLFVEDDSSLREIISINLEDLGFQVDQAHDGTQALEIFLEADRRGAPYRVVLTDVKMPGMSGLELLDRLRDFDPEVNVIVLTAFGGVEHALEAMRRGAFHYVEKPVNMSALHTELLRALRRHRAEAHRERGDPVEPQARRHHQSSGLITSSPSMSRVLKTVDRVASSDAPVMILGESGVGKELIAKALHHRSNRAEGPWVAVNCAALPSELLESVLFGYEKGAFTGAQQRRDGKFSAADGGTLFLDEIAEMSPALQAKLLRVLQDGVVERVGSLHPEVVSVRIVTATHQNLENAIERGEFRRDLYYRLHVIPIYLPPLRERSEDIPVLIRHFLRDFAPDATIELEASLDEACLKYPWPGNIRELRNVIERMVLLRDEDRLGLQDLPAELRQSAISASPEAHAEDQSARTTEDEALVKVSGISFTLPKDHLDLKRLERAVILTALRLHQGNQSATARYLNIPRHTLIYRLEKFTEGD